jgi:hypothetical protein
MCRVNVRRECIHDISLSMKYGYSRQEFRICWFLDNKPLSVVKLAYEIMSYHIIDNALGMLIYQLYKNEYIQILLKFLLLLTRAL